MAAPRIVGSGGVASSPNPTATWTINAQDHLRRVSGFDFRQDVCNQRQKVNLTPST